ncbi:MAG: UbiA family prenyltransferase [Shimia sp.]|jgi:4-hydroxybenzoate polyprenyltransferase/phosphoglycolate phosphatase-like HAD superfamily hydrolase|uniref:UbiA family prenyltransferase n=1 Tax=Shimia sp. TaxID=1954381 RepID=UPI001B10E089|nr:UbiA family prenyltransferase [Shimia sp.]MBO6899320.1 UbiA family prenyltransferase [Shimia sp.]
MIKKDRNIGQNRTIDKDAGQHDDCSANMPLYVDLDGTLTPTDTAQEQILDCLFNGRGLVPLIKAAIVLDIPEAKSAASIHAEFRADLLPFCGELIKYIRNARALGRPVVLATAADQRTADAVAKHLGIFDRVLASKDGQNLKGKTKLLAIKKDAGNGDFEYVGDSRADLEIWNAATKVGFVATQHKIEKWTLIWGYKTTLSVTSKHSLSDLIRAMRPQQWAKNLLVFLPLLFAHAYSEIEALEASLISFVAFSFVAAAVYILNDLSDLAADRQHPRKRLRPFAAGKASPITGIVTALVLLCVAFAISLLTLSVPFAMFLLIYLCTTTAYTIVLKQYSTIDVLTLAFLYTLRVGAGAVATGLSISPWLLTFCFFFFVSLAYMKRFIEVLDVAEQGEKLPSRNYWGGEDTLMFSFGIVNAGLCLLTLAQYIGSSSIEVAYSAPDLLWLTIPLIMFWLNRSWLYAARGKVGDDPVAFAVRDRISRLVLFLVVVTIFIAKYLTLETVLL